MNNSYDLTLIHLLNCFYRETKFYQWMDRETITIDLDVLNIELVVHIKSVNSFGLPKWALPVCVQEKPISSLLAIQLLLNKLTSVGQDVLIRIINSAENLNLILNTRKNNLEDLFASQVDFLSSEQGLLQGHTLQPDAKSRVGFSVEQFKEFSPETQGCFQLYYFLVSADLIAEDSVLPQSMTELVAQDFSEQIQQYPDYKLLPLHPWQAQYLLNKPEIKQLVENKKCIDLGVHGELYYPTTSVRTVYNPNSPFMYKFSLSVAITNSVRINLNKECDRSIAVSKISDGTLGNIIKQKFPKFTLITDPGYIALKINGKVMDESICIVRNNPFRSHYNNVTCIASICQQHPSKNHSRIKQLVQEVSDKQQLDLQTAAQHWYDEYLKLVIAPILWLYSEYGLALEAHQQNLLVEIKQGLPVASFYRDSQGYYYLKDDNPALFDIVPAEILEPLCGEDIDFVTHHFAYYFIVNQLFSVIDCLINTRFITEKILTSKTKSFFQGFAQEYQTQSFFCDYLLSSKTLPCKANLLTRLKGLDELQAPLTEQSVYTQIDNQLCITGGTDEYC